VIAEAENGQRTTVGAMRWYSEQWPAPGKPWALLLHGTGASAHSMQALAQVLCETHAVLVPDLPGHARTHTPATQALDLPSVARSTAEWLACLQVKPTVIVGHSAGAAVALRMVLDGTAQPQTLVSINGALLPLQGLAGQFFLPLARLLVLNPLVPKVFSKAAGLPMVIDRLLHSTGSRVDEASAQRYAQLLTDPAHVAGVLRLMASWDLAALAADLPKLKTPLHLVVGLNDHTIEPELAQRVQALLPSARRSELPGLGHLAHEEDAAAVLRVIASLL
jgi:magnesium chelatase accessory protein